MTRAVAKWRCLLCKPSRWRIGPIADWAYHYATLHTDRKDT